MTVFLAIIPMYLMGWVCFCSDIIRSNYKCNFGVISLPYVIYNDSSFACLQNLCCKQFVLRNIKKLAIAITVISFPYTFVVLLFLSVSSYPTGIVCYLPIEQSLKSPPSKFKKSDIFEFNLNQFFLAITSRLQVLLTLSVVSFITGIIFQQCALCCLAIPSYLLLIIMPGDYMIRKCLSPEYGIFLFLKPMLKSTESQREYLILKNIIK